MDRNSKSYNPVYPCRPDMESRCVRFFFNNPFIVSDMLAVEWPLPRAAISESATTPSIVSPSAAAHRLQVLKSKVPKMQAKYGNRKWEIAIRDNRPSPKVVVSRAYHKLREIQRSCALPMPRMSLHLAEAPGGFVQATFDAVTERNCAEEWRWWATSLDVPNAPRPQVSHVIPSHHGEFLDSLPDSGDILRPACADAIAEIVKESADLVTADGAVEMNHNLLEEEHYRLLVAQTNVAVRCLCRGATLIIKFFEGNLAQTQAWIAWMTTQFGTVSLIKPSTSRATNSERYLVARDYAGQRDTLHGEYTVAKGWLQDLQKITDQMSNAQSDALERVFRLVT